MRPIRELFRLARRIHAIYEKQQADSQKAQGAYWVLLQRHFERLALQHGLAGDDGRDGAAAPAVFGRFEADRCNELWVGDALHGPVLAGRKTYLFCAWLA